MSSQLNQCFTNCTQLICSCTAPGYYWSSTLWEFLAVTAVIVDFQVGLIQADFTYDSLKTHYVRAVRGGL